MSRIKGFEMGKIFISYSHADLQFVSLLARGLRIAGVHFWRDIEQMSGGQSLSREVELAIEDSSLFLCVVSKDFDNSKWLRNELACAVDTDSFIVPLVFEGAKIPIHLRDKLQIRVRESGPAWNASEMFRLVEEIRSAIGLAIPTDFDDFDPESSDCEWDEDEEVSEILSGTRWSWCEGLEPTGSDHWIEFLSGGGLRRSWRSDLGTWKVAAKRLVVYGGHALIFDLDQKIFRGAFTSADKSNILRCGKLIGGELG